VDPGSPPLWVLRVGLEVGRHEVRVRRRRVRSVHGARRRVATRACVLPVSLVGDRPIVTIEAVANDAVGRVVPDAWVSEDVVQCGYCQSGQIMTAVALLKSTRRPTDADIEQSMGGNLCRCGTYVRIREAIKTASRHLAGGGR
jgi:isoquinoline 1-oxidoreductase alpha subunit